MSFWLGIGMVVLPGAVLVAWEIRDAPEGYEDETGFRLGKPPTTHRPDLSP